MTYPIVPVRLWMGYALPALQSDRSRFYSELGSIFIPATVQMMAPLGLTGYIPGVVPPNRLPEVPDEVALVFYESVDAYEKARISSTAGRAYGLLHQTVFSFSESRRPASHSGFPHLFEPEAFSAGKLPYCSLFPPGGNWQHGHWQSTVVVLAEGSGDIERARHRLSERLAAVQMAPPPGLLSTFVAIRGAAVVCWSQWDQGAAMRALIENFPGAEIAADLAAQPVSIPPDPAADFSGLPVEAGTSFNFQFEVQSGGHGS